jgi:hypothetical protein
LLKLAITDIPALSVTVEALARSAVEVDAASGHRTLLA